jgi:hypothetical protein
MRPVVGAFVKRGLVSGEARPKFDAAIAAPTWYGMAGAGRLQPTLAGWWFGCVSLPLIQFILMRWYFRLFIWARFLWHVSRIGLQLVPTHPDRAGGLGFLSNLSYAFAPLLAGQGVLLACVMANRIFHAGAPSDEALVGSADVQSLAGMGNSYEVVKSMKLAPFGKDTVLQLALISLAPVAPLVLTMIPVGELIDQFLKIIF